MPSPPPRLRAYSMLQRSSFRAVGVFQESPNLETTGTMLSEECLFGRFSDHLEQRQKISVDASSDSADADARATDEDAERR